MMQMRTAMTLLGLLLSVGCTSALDDVSDDAVVDSDGDGYIDTMDGCPDDIMQWTDVDGDGYCDEIDDACPDDPNEWTDTDGDGVCDNSDPCPEDFTQKTDADGDGVCDERDDACPDDQVLAGHGW